MWYWNSNQGRVFSPSSGKHIFRNDILYFRATNIENHKCYISSGTAHDVCLLKPLLGVYYIFVKCSMGLLSIFF